MAAQGGDKGRNKAKMKNLLLTLVALFLLAACGGGTDYAPPAVQQTEIVWTKHAPTPGAQGNYLALVQQGADLRAFGNFNGTDNTHEAKLYEWRGTFAGVGNVRVVLDVPGAYLRTLGVARDADGACYALLRLGTAYGQSSYYPAWAKSDRNCENWQLIKEKLWLGNSNSNTLNVDSSKPQIINSTEPRNNRFTALDDSFGHKLALAYSGDGLTWGHTDAELYPADAGGNPQFASEAVTPFGYHVIVADWSDAQGAATRHVHLYSCDGLKYRVVDRAAPTYNGPKGTSLAYEPTTGRVHALTNGQHLSFPATKLSCAQ